MTIVPALDAKPVAETNAGELIRFPLRGKMILGIVAGCDFLQLPSGKVIVLLEDMPERPGTLLRFMPATDYLMTALCLSYGTEHRLVVHPSARSASMNDEEYGMNGALLVGEGKRVVRSRAAGDNFNEYALYIDADSWTAVQYSYSQPRGVAVLGWELRLTFEVSPDPPPPPVFVFGAAG